MFCKIKSMHDVRVHEIKKIVHSHYLSFYCRKERVTLTSELMDGTHVLLIENLPSTAQIIDANGELKQGIPFRLKSTITLKLKRTPSQSAVKLEREETLSPFDKIPPLSASVVEYEKKNAASNAFDSILGAGKQIFNDFVADQAASQAQWFNEKGIIKQKDKLTNEFLTNKEISERYKDTETLAISSAERIGADAVKNLPAYEETLLAASIIASRGRNLKNLAKDFANEEKLVDHFVKHGKEFGAKSKEEYLDLARSVIDDGVKVEYPYKGENRTGFVKLMGTNRRGEAKFAFVGTNQEGYITTLHTKSGKDFWKTLNQNAKDKVIRPAK